MLILGGSAAAQEGIHKCKKDWFGMPAPELRTPQDVANALRRKKNSRLWWWHRKVSSYYSTPVKRMGIFGWTDYCTEVCGTGDVYYAAASRHHFYTVDLALSDLSVNGEHPVLQGTRFLRVEMHGAANDPSAVLPRAGDKARICGKLMWDGDGFLEIHPRRPADTVILLSPKPSESLRAGRFRGLGRKLSVLVEISLHLLVVEEIVLHLP